MNLFDESLHALHEKLKAKEVSSSELTENVLGRIEAVEPKVSAYITHTTERALADAKKADEFISKNKDFHPLTGMPIALKDIFLTEGIATTCGSHILEGFIPPYNASVVEKMNEAPWVLLGKLNMDEFAMGSSNETSFFGSTKNPWDLERIPGGSSGGSAAAVACGTSIATLGTDTGGSIRQPASLCGIVGLKPTYGRVSRYGVIAFASSLDQVGPMTKDVTDCALMLQTIAGHDPKDSTSLSETVPDYSAALKKDIKGMKIGVPQEYFSGGLDEDTEKTVRKAIATYKELGAEIIDVSLPHTEYAVPTYYILAPAEASSNLARYDGVRFGFRNQEADNLTEMYLKSRSEGFGDEVKRRIMLGTYALSAGYYDAYYLKAQKVRTLIRQDFTQLFEARTVDLILGPVSPSTAFKIGEKTDDPLQMYLSDILTIAVNLAGLPGMSLPCGFSNEGLPIGLQIIGPALGEASMLHAAYAYEQATEWHTKRPQL
jgi:aspartyl-tRNA(Asn)/glutamyl-tRNA(Gln) amidotransferase subunit A